MTPELVAALQASGKTTYVGLHSNHPRELTPAARTACARLIDAGLALVSQTVLLRGVNDDPETLTALMRAFVEMRIRPYYLHHGDLAPGTAHFRVTLEEGRRLMRALAGTDLGTLPADLRARHPGRIRQGPGRAGLRRRGRPLGHRTPGVRPTTTRGDDPGYRALSFPGRCRP